MGKFLTFMILVAGWYFQFPYISPVYLKIASYAWLSWFILGLIFGKKSTTEQKNQDGNSLVETVVQGAKRPPTTKKKKKIEKSLVGSMVENQIKMMDGQDPFYEQKQKKINKRHFSTRQIKNIVQEKEIPEKKATQVNQHVDDSAKTKISFKQLQEFDCYLPSIEGTLGDFLNAGDKFSCALTSFFVEEEEKQIAEIMENRRYPELSDLLMAKAIENKNNQAVKELLKGPEFKKLQYGKCFHYQKKDNRKSTPYNVKLYKEIVCLLQEIFVRYTNDQQKKNYHTLDQLLDDLPWEKIENLEFQVSLENFGKMALDVLVENFLNSLKPMKEQISEYRSLRLALRYLDVKEPLDTGIVIHGIIGEIQTTYDKIQECTAIKSRDEISELIETTKVVPLFKQIPKETQEDSVSEEEEKELREMIIAVVNFLGWLPQEAGMITAEEKNLIAYFNKLMYSRRTRLAIVEDEQHELTRIYKNKLGRIIEKIKDAEQKLESIRQRYQGNLEGVIIHIATPQQSEDYFPLTGTIMEEIREPLENTYITKLIVQEQNRLQSFIIFTGNNVEFS